MSLISDRFFTDPRVCNAQQHLLEALREHQAAFTEIREPQQALKTSYQAMLEEFEKIRGGALFFPYLSSGIGRGLFVELADGSVKYDFINGIGVHHFGHSHPGIIEKALQGALLDTVMQGHLQQSTHAYQFSKRLLAAAQTPGNALKHCFLSSTGVMAGENALKAAFQKAYPADRVLAYKGCFAGRTLAFAQITDKPAYREGLPKALSVDYIPFFDPKHPEKSTNDALIALKSHLERYPGKHAAMFFELILGEGGYYEAPAQFHAQLMEVCKQAGIFVLVDEVQSFARTSRLFAFQHYGLERFVDAVWIGKASQICATLFTSELKPKPGLLSQTFTGSGAAILTGDFIIKTLLEGDYFGEKGKIMQLGQYFIAGLQAIEMRQPKLISGPYGLGAMIAFTPLDGSTERVTQFVKALYANGVISFIAGKEPACRARFLMPVGAITFEDLDAVLEIIEKTLIDLA